MSYANFFGLLLLGCGPLAAVYLVCIAPKSFLVLLTLGSAFYWLVTLFLISGLFRGWAPLLASPGPYAALLLVAVLVQELARLGITRFNRMLVRVLNRIAAEQQDSPLSVADRFSLALSYGFSHGAVHSTFFFASWLPLSLGSGTIYSPRCPQLSYFAVAALTSLAFAALHTSGMVLWFAALERRRLGSALAVPAAHAVAALVTLLNFAHSGCLVSILLLLAGGAVAAALAGRVWWVCATSRAALLSRPGGPGSGLAAAAGDIHGTGGGDVSPTAQAH